MKKIGLYLIVGILFFTISLFFTETTQVFAETTTQEQLVDELTLQAEVIKNIVVSLVVSFLGTGVVAVIVNVALNNLIKQAKDKIAEAVSQGKLSQETADKALALLDTGVVQIQKSVDLLVEKVVDIANASKTTESSVDILVQESILRSEKILALIGEYVEEFGEDINE